jgi:hypothetical protein
VTLQLAAACNIQLLSASEHFCRESNIHTNFTAATTENAMLIRKYTWPVAADVAEVAAEAALQLTLFPS